MLFPYGLKAYETSPQECRKNSQARDSADRVRIYIVSSREAQEPRLDYLQRIDPDRTDGDSIANRQEFSELRAHYWVWKNTKPYEHVGFFQFRRYLDLSGANRHKPFYLFKMPKPESFAGINFYLAYDVVAPIAEYTGESVYQRYVRTHDAEELKLVREILCELYPSYEGAVNTYLGGMSEYYCNLYLMRWEVFIEYSKWLFDILDEFSLRAKKVSPRSCGYLAERLFGIWYTHIRSSGHYKCIEVPRLHFWCFDDKTHHYKRESLMTWLLPPGSGRRAFFRQLLVRCETVVRRVK